VGQTVNVMTCINCKIEKFHFSNFWTLHVWPDHDDKIKITLAEMLDTMASEEEEQGVCKICHAKKGFQTKTWISKLPEILIICCGRFQDFEGRLRKSDYIVSYPKKLELSKYMIPIGKAHYIFL